MNVNREFGFAERLAKSVRPFMHLAIYRQIHVEEDSNGHKQIHVGEMCQRINVYHHAEIRKWDMPGELTWLQWRRHQLEVMNVNRELSFAERLAKSRRQSVHSAIDRQIEDSNGHKQNRWDIHVHHYRWAVKIGEIYQESWRDPKHH